MKLGEGRGTRTVAQGDHKSLGGSMLTWPYLADQDSLRKLGDSAPRFRIYEKLILAVDYILSIMFSVSEVLS